MTFQAPQLANFPVILEVMTLIQSDGRLRGTNTDLIGRCISAMLHAVLTF
jgi:shikimate 5-dehydrogenase